MMPLAAIQVTFGRERALLLLLLIPLIGFISWRAVWRPKRLRRSVLLLRLAMLALMIGALADPLAASTGNASTTILLVDQSTSVTSNSESGVNSWVKDALASAGTGDNAAVVAFGGSADLVVPSSPASGISQDWTDGIDTSTIDPSFTNIESAVALARSLAGRRESADRAGFRRIRESGLSSESGRRRPPGMACRSMWSR